MFIYNFVGNIYEKNAERYYEKLFGIMTSGKIILENRYGYSNYTPSPYHYLAKYFRQYPFEKGYSYVNFGCGLGRTVFLASYYGCSKAIGVDVNKAMYEGAIKNQKNFKRNVVDEEILFYHQKAEEFEIKNEYSYFYFYNPFYLKYFIKVIRNITKSYKNCKRKIRIILYCPAEEYISYLSTQEILYKSEDIYFRDGAFLVTYGYR